MENKIDLNEITIDMFNLLDQQEVEASNEVLQNKQVLKAQVVSHFDTTLMVIVYLNPPAETSNSDEVEEPVDEGEDHSTEVEVDDNVE